MSFIELANTRYSVRTFEDKPVEKEKLLQVLEAARIAPSAVNFQPWHFIVVTDTEMKQKVSEVYPRKWFQDAPVIIIACGDHSKSWKRRDGKDHCDIDMAIAIEHMMLEATDLGLGSCWVCAFDASRCHELLGLPEHLEAVALIPLGYPKGDRPQERNRRELREIVSWESYKG
jgi:nitroreductase